MKFIIRVPLLVTVGTMLAWAQSGPIVSRPAHHDLSQDLFSMVLDSKKHPPPPNSQGLIHRHRKVAEDELLEVADSVKATYTAPLSVTEVQTSTDSSPFFSATAGANFEGLGTGFAGYSVGVAPPDTTLAVGPNHVVQWVNSHYAVFDKAGNKLLPGSGFVAGNTLWSGFGGVCETTNRGDPVVQYDHLADRWVFSQFAFSVTGGNPSAPFTQCFAVSTSGNPLGTYNRYSYVFTDFNDYGKLGVWPDAYYMSYNMFSGGSGPNTGVAPCAYDRTAMLAGAVATSVCMPTNFYAGGAAFLPSDWDGSTAPAAGAPNIFMRQSTFGTGVLRMIKFHVDFVTPANSTFNDGFGGALGTFIALPITLTRACNGTGGTCIAQPGTTNTLDTLGDRLMYRLSYRKIGTTESLMVTQSEDPDGAGAVGSAVRWYEVRNPFGATPSLFQNATFAPDSSNRWMGSVAMDKVGNMLIGYSVSDASVFPSVRITGRLRSEIRNQLQVESTIVSGSGSQTGTLTRWGDYSTMQVDPADDCTFWYTTEYMAANGTFNWRTRIASFKFPNCQ